MHRFTPSRRTRLVLAAGALAAVTVGVGPAGPAAEAQQCSIQLQADAYTTPVDTALVVPNDGVVTNDTICGTDGLVISTGSPAHGTLTNFDDDSGGFTYTPDPGFTGTDSFTYTLEDVQAIPSVTVTITVEAAPTTTVTTASTTTTTAPATTETSVPVTSTVPPVVPATPATPVAAAPSFTG